MVWHTVGLQLRIADCISTWLPQAEPVSPRVSTGACWLWESRTGLEGDRAMGLPLRDQLWPCTWSSGWFSAHVPTCVLA